MDFVIIANQWDVHKDNPTSKHHVAMELIKMGHRVLWVVGSGMRTPSVGSKSDRGRIWKKISDAVKHITRHEARGTRPEDNGWVWVIAPLILPFPGSGLARRINEWIYLGSIRRASGKLGFEDPVLINFLPVIPGVLEKWCGKSIYYCVDKWSAFGEYDAELMDRLDAECCSNADLVIASARDLEERCRKHNENTELILHGVDCDHFSKFASRFTFHASRPPDLPEGRVVGFFGLLSAWVDQELLVYLAKELRAHRGTGNAENVNIVLIGKSDTDVSRLEAEPNIYLIGRKKYEDLPDYLAFFDVGIIPFAVNELTKAVNPIKLREMLAGGCRVVSTALPEVRTLEQESSVVRSLSSSEVAEKPSGGVKVASDHAEFIDMVNRCLNNPLDKDDRRVLSESMLGETWRTKVEQMLEVIS